ncbi:acyltransferase family protein [Vibrio splendidus]|uniref:acyltransferase family protein n=1 Tax=Vibrio splendidus TaxID=29497 RepID=UPI000D3C6058|nr:acyltransferase family protein [Vibrio splendidus]PTO85995.1 hypothetical protein CWO29_19565 [Vibrio splendidus]
MKFRYDINGIRAIAILAVVIFHFNPLWLPGGFAGVDMFFVISGYLMTKIIFDSLANDSFSFARFYLSRIKRIYPALIFVCFSCLAIGYWVLSPIEYAQLGIHVGSSLAFISNIVYWKESGYFDPDSTTKWLLHTWSLSVEWQFYILFPIFVWCALKVLSKDIVRWTIFICTILSLILSSYASLRWQSASYYLLPTRGWELLAGSCIYLFPFSRMSSSRLIEVFGLMLVILPLFIFNSHSIWPGYNAVLPVLGVCLILYSDMKEKSLLSNKFLQSIGLISYSLYLWHWPLLVFLNKIGLSNSQILIVGVSTSLSFAYISYFFIEKLTKVSLIAFLTSVTFSVVFIIYCSDGAGFRVEDKYKYSANEMNSFGYGGGQYKSNDFYHLGNEGLDFFMFGDSFGQQYSIGLEKSNFGFEMYFDHGCFVSPNLTRFVNGIRDVDCSNSFDMIKNYFLQSPNTPIIIGSSWNYGNNHKYKDGSFSVSESNWSEIVEKELKDIAFELGDKRVYILIGRPQNDPTKAYDCLSKQGMLFSNKCNMFSDIQNQSINTTLMEFSENNSNFYYIDINKAFCDSGRCLVSNGRFPIYSDGSHFSEFGSNYVSKYLNDELGRIKSKILNL